MEQYRTKTLLIFALYDSKVTSFLMVTTLEVINMIEELTNFFLFIKLVAVTWEIVICSLLRTVPPSSMVFLCGL